jgi:predicted nucleic acid-binding protein
VTLVIDASFVVAALTDPGAAGQWAESLVEGEALAAPHLILVEAANILRRATLAEVLTTAEAGMAHADLLQLRVELFAYPAFASRVWALRDNCTAYDAWYVALAEGLGAPLATLDLRLSVATGPTCRFLTPPERRD